MLGIYINIILFREILDSRHAWAYDRLRRPRLELCYRGAYRAASSSPCPVESNQEAVRRERGKSGSVR